MTDQKNIPLSQSLKNSREKGIRAAHAKAAAAQREQRAADEDQGFTGKYGNGRASRRPGCISEVPPHCYRKSGMTDDEATVAAVTAMKITHPLDIILTFWTLRAGNEAEIPSATNFGNPRKKHASPNKANDYPQHHPLKG